MSTYQYKCLKCQERHDQEVADCELEDTYFAPCPVCGFVARRLAAPAEAKEGGRSRYRTLAAIPH